MSKSTKSTKAGREQIRELVKEYADSDWLDVAETPMMGGKIGCVTIISKRDDFPFSLMLELYEGNKYDLLHLYHAGRTSEEDGYRPFLRFTA